MAVVQKSVLVGYSAQQMFDMVDGVEAYPSFLPWCSGTTVIYRDATRTRATMHVNYHGVKQSFTTENSKEPPRRITMQLVEGPFRVLEGEWLFAALADDACRIDFRLRYEFSSKLLERLVGRVFGYIANTMVDAFVKRADALYAA